jgi:glycosyltransferase involved in cell wall biosynthesis
VYGLSKEKVELLVLGADDNKVQEAKQPKVRKQIRDKFRVDENDFLIMTGGKIDAFKTQTLLLMEAVARIKNDKVKLIVFGTVTPELKEKVNNLCLENKIKYIGWIASQESYKYFAAADLVVFPGRHSVFWEQVAAQGIPMVCKYWNGTTHIDLNGNVEFLREDSVDEIKRVLDNIIDDKEKYINMKIVAEEEGMKAFSYKDIAKRSIEMW